MKLLKETILKETILFFVGFCIYITIETCFRGYSYPLMGMIAGIAIVILDGINDCISWELDLIIQGLMGSGLITTFELVIGKIQRVGGMIPMWDYSNLPFNYQGVICLPFSIVWIGMSLIGIFVADAINYYVFEELPVPYYKLFGKTVIKFKEKHCKLKQ